MVRRRVLTNRAESPDVSQFSSSTDVVRIQNIKDPTKSAGLKLTDLKKIEHVNANTVLTSKHKASEPEKQDAIVKGMTFRGYRMDEVGHKMEKEGGKAFYDQEIIGDKRVSIFAVKVWHDNNCISGLQAGYRSKQKELIQGIEHVLDKEKCQSMLFYLKDEQDYLREVKGFINKEENVIESLTLISAKGTNMTVGKEKKKSKPFRFDINELEYPAVFHGSLRSKQRVNFTGNNVIGQGKGKGSVLCRLGVLIGSEEIEENIVEKALEKSGVSQGNKLKRKVIFF